jgi:hypothetical protein
MMPPNRHAYVLYATDDRYAVAVLVFLRLLRALGTRSDADVLVLHLPLSPDVVRMISREGAIPLEVLPFGSGRGPAHFKDCMVKLRIFELTQYERVVYVDADALPVRSLDHLFELPLSAPVAAPAAYWLVQPFWTTALLVVHPSERQWDRVSRQVAATPTSACPWPDMCFVNREFAGEIQAIRGPELVLDSEWADATLPCFFGDRRKTYSEASVVHFTALGKPWSRTVDEVRALRPRAHELFYEMWATWRQARAEILVELGRDLEAPRVGSSPALRAASDAPRIAADVEIHETNDGLIASKGSTDRVHYLNETAAVVLRLCDGTRNIEQIAARMGELFELQDPPIGETRACIGDLVREGLIA